MAKGITAPDVDKRSASAASKEGPKSSDIRLRAFIVGLIIIPFDNYWVLMMEKVYSGPYVTTVSLFANVVFILAVLAAVNSLLRKISPRLAFSSAEMLLIYAMTAMATALAGHDLMPNLVGFMGHSWIGATPENNWANTFLPYLPKWLSVTDHEALKSLYMGNSSLYENGHWLIWLKPCLWWLSFIIVLVFVMMCINTLLRKQWTERERLTFPMVQLPIAMTEPKGEIWRNKLFWFGFALAFGIDLINGLSLYFPALPSINLGATGHSLSEGITSRPWNALGFMPYSFYPFVIGLGYLLPADLSFSCWFFYLFWKMEWVFASAMGWDESFGFPFPSQQQFGGYIAITILLLWSSRHYLKQVWLKIKAGKSELDDSDEPMSYRTAVAGALIGFAYLAAFMMRIGLSPMTAVVAFILYFVLATAIARMRAELGPPVHDIYYAGADTIIPPSVGLDRLSNGDFIGLTYFHWFNRAQRCHPMPIGIEGMKMAQITKSSQQKFFWGIMLAVAVGAIAAFWCHLHIGYDLGLASSKCRIGLGFGGNSLRNLEKWWPRPAELSGPNWGANMAMLGGFLFCTFLSYMRTRIFGWPFHPIGYAISGSFSMSLVWAPLMIAWLLKSSTLKFGGLKLYTKAIPLFLGLVLGQMVMGCIWSLIGITFDVPYYSFWEAWC